MFNNRRHVINLLVVLVVLQNLEAMEIIEDKNQEIVSKQGVDTSVISPSTYGKTIAYKDFTPEMIDYIRLQNIQYLFQHRSKLHPLCFLNNLSWQVDGMAVLKRSFRDRTTVIAPVWSALAYLHRGLSLKETSGEFLQAFVEKISPFLEDVPQLLTELEKLEHTKASIRQYMETLPAQLVQQAYEQTAKANLKQPNTIIKDEYKIDDGDTDLFLSGSQTTMHDEDDLQKIQKCTLFTHEYKFEQAMEVVEQYITETTGDLTGAKKGREEVKRRESELQANMNDLNKLFSSQSIQKLVGIFYEYESLKEAQASLFELGKLDLPNINWEINSVARRTLLQTITVLGEALNNISTNLPLDATQDILSFIPTVKYLRNVLEHPTDYKKDKFVQLLANHQLANQVLGGLSQDLLGLGTRLENRLNTIRSILKTQDKCNELLESILTAEPVKKEEVGTQPGNVPKNFKDLLLQAQWQDNGLSFAQWLRRYFYHPTYSLQDPTTEDLAQAARDVVKNEKKARSKPSGKTTSIDEVITDINDLSQLVKSHSNRIEFLKAIKVDRVAYAQLTNLVTQIFLKLNTMIEGHDLVFYNSLMPNNKKLFEIIFNDLRDRRNFTIHDLWRKDLRGLTKIAYLITYNLQPILTPIQPLLINEATKQMWQAIFDQTIDMDILVDLISQGADINAPADDSWPPLAYLISHGADYQDSCIQAILKHGAQPNQCNNEGDYPLHVAAEDGRLDLVELLCDAGAIPDVKNIWGYTPEDEALSNGHEDLAMYLRGMESRFRGDKADKLHRNSAYFTFDDSYIHPIIGCCPNLLNADGELPLVLTIQKSDMDNQQAVLKVVKSLVQAGAEVSKSQFLDGTTPLIAAVCDTKDPLLVIYFLEQGANADEVDHYGWSALHYAAQLNKHLFMKMLLHANASPHLQDGDGRTPLLVNLNTPKGGNLETIGLLLGAGSIPTTSDKVLGNAFHYAQQSGRSDILEILGNAMK